MKRLARFAVGVVALAGAAGCLTARASEESSAKATPIFGVELPDGYRDWPLITVAREEWLKDIRAVLGNERALDAYRRGRLPFPDGTIIARLAWEYRASEENEAAFARVLKGPPGERFGSFVAGHPVNGVQFMVKDSKRYAATGGWGFAQFDDGKPADVKVHQGCFPCHEAARERDFVFSRHAR
jgi:hypothetical protein